MYEARVIGTDILVIADNMDDAYAIIAIMNDDNGEVSMKYNAEL